VKNWGDSQAGQFHFGLFADGGQENILLNKPMARHPMSAKASNSLSSWQHVAFVCDGSTVRLYRNGAEVATTRTTAPVPASMKSVGIGVKLNNEGTEADTGNPGYWHGKMDDVGIWSGSRCVRNPGHLQRGLAGEDLSQAGQNPLPMLWPVIGSSMKPKATKRRRHRQQE
jgi:hypothetical protein